MIVAGVGTLLLTVVAGAGASSGGEALRLAQVTVRQRVIVRVPARAVRAVDPRAIRYEEKKAPRCVAMAGLAGAAMLKADRVDLILKGGQRLRVEFESSCTAVDFYSGFYVSPTEDRQLCAQRDSIHLRSGGECMIKRFKKLVPER